MYLYKYMDKLTCGFFSTPCGALVYARIALARPMLTVLCTHVRYWKSQLTAIGSSPLAIGEHIIPAVFPEAESKV